MSAGIGALAALLPLALPIHNLWPTIHNAVLLLLTASGQLAALLLGRWCRRVLAELDIELVDADDTVNASAARFAAIATRPTCKSGLREVPLSDAASNARNSWSAVHWQSIVLRVGPDYNRNKHKRPSKAPLLPCVGVDVFKVDRKA